MSKRLRKKISTEIVTTTLTQQLNHEGRGVAHINGKATFLLGGLPGEKIKFRYTHCHSQFDEGIVTEVLEESFHREVVRCRHFGVCGGCSLQHVSLDAQRLHKQKIVLEHFQHQAHCQPKTILEPLYGNPWEYRRRARLSVRYVPKKNVVLVGFHERSSRYVADIHQCEILHPSIGRKIKALGELLMQCEMKAQIAQLEIAVGDNAAAVVIRNLVKLPDHDTQKLILFARENQLQFYLQPKGPDHIYPLFPENPEKLFYMSEGAIKMYFQPTQFTQINYDINIKMIHRALELLDLQKTDRVLDLFCGIGNFSLPIATHAHKVIGVEGSSSAIQQAKKNALENKINNTEFFTQDLSIDLNRVPWSHNQYNKIVLDPPRTGAKELLPYVAIWKPERIVYISCNPITLARDAKDLLLLGYRLEKAGVIDMFPHTGHVEAIALFVKIK